MPSKKCIPLICEWCREPFLGERPTRRFCGRSCAMTSVHQSPEWREKSRHIMLKIRKRPDVQQKLRLHLLSDSNPLRDPKNKRKAQIVLREMGYLTLNGGNGQLTVPQQLLSQRLGWTTEYTVPVKPRRKDLPTNLKIDIAEPLLKIAIEVDGHSHIGAKAKARDQKKDQFLAAQGWTVLRFWNREVLADIDAVVKAVLATVKCST